ncbi:hypothetical protein EVAR_30459_1 [Eumeta japonica]|uniref:Uncharacterized protein n=1 Tax=Eumeta variegata TaxID=151549 RepID=A0A4C1VYV5_EUMVA|nr:hypothetical protein EVAR_30459_1 [Eumeta japonica]
MKKNCPKPKISFVASIPIEEEMQTWTRSRVRNNLLEKRKGCGIRFIGIPRRFFDLARITGRLMGSRKASASFDSAPFEEAQVSDRKNRSRNVVRSLAGRPDGWTTEWMDNHVDRRQNGRSNRHRYHNSIVSAGSGSGIVSEIGFDTESTRNEIKNLTEIGSMTGIRNENAETDIGTDSRTTIAIQNRTNMEIKKKSLGVKKIKELILRLRGRSRTRADV